MQGFYLKGKEKQHCRAHSAAPPSSSHPLLLGARHSSCSNTDSRPAQSCKLARASYTAAFDAALRVLGTYTAPHPLLLLHYSIYSTALYVWEKG